MPTNPEDFLNEDIASGQLPAAGDQFISQEPVAPMSNISNVLPANNPSFESKLSQSSLGLSASDQLLMANDADRELMKLIEAGYPVGATGDLGESTYFPGMQDPILKAYSSSKTLGSQPIFVRSGGYIPYGVLDARKKALQDAAIARANQQRAFDRPKIPTVKDPRFQAAVNEKFDSIIQGRIQEARSLYGEKAFQLLQDPRSSVGQKFRQDLDNLDIIARETDQITDLVGKIEEGRMKGEASISGDTQKLLNEYYTLTNNFLSGKASGDIRSNLNQLKASFNIDKYLKENIMTELERKVSEGLSGFGDKGDFYEQKKYHTETVDESARQIAKDLKGKGGYYEFDNLVTEDMIVSKIKSLMPDVKKVDSQTVGKPGGGSGYDYSNEGEVNVQDHRTIKIGDSQFGVRNAVDLKTRNNSKPWNVTGGIFFGQDGTEKKVSGVTSFIPSTMGDYDIPVVDKNTGEKNIQKTKGIAGFLIEKKPVEVPDPTTGLSKVYYQEVKTPVVMDVHGQEAKLKSEIPTAYKVFSESSGVEDPDTGVKSTTTTKTDKSGNEQITVTTKTQGGKSDVTEEQYNALPKGAKYYFGGKEYTKK